MSRHHTTKCDVCGALRNAESNGWMQIVKPQQAPSTLVIRMRTSEHEEPSESGADGVLDTCSPACLTKQIGSEVSAWQLRSNQYASGQRALVPIDGGQNEHSR